MAYQESALKSNGYVQRASGSVRVKRKGEEDKIKKTKITPLSFIWMTTGREDRYGPRTMDRCGEVNQVGCGVGGLRT